MRKNDIFSSLEGNSRSPFTLLLAYLQSIVAKAAHHKKRGVTLAYHCVP
jgi:hypothetical protein